MLEIASVAYSDWGKYFFFLMILISTFSYMISKTQNTLL